MIILITISYVINFKLYKFVMFTYNILFLFWGRSSGKAPSNPEGKNKIQYLSIYLSIYIISIKILINITFVISF